MCTFVTGRLVVPTRSPSRGNTLAQSWLVTDLSDTMYAVQDNNFLCRIAHRLVSCQIPIGQC